MRFSSSEESFLGQVLGFLDLSSTGPYTALLTVCLDTPNILAVFDMFLLFASNTFRINSLAFQMFRKEAQILVVCKSVYSKTCN